MILSKWLINGILWHFTINADISILDKSIILGPLFCVFAWYSGLTHANDSLTYWLPDRIKTINWLWKAFSCLGMSSAAENAQKVCSILRIFAIYPRLNSKFSILKPVGDV